MSTPALRRVIVNADDFGLSDGVNEGVSRAHVEGIVTSASLLAFGRCAREAAAIARAHPRLSVGLHVDLGEWRWAGGTWVPVYKLVDTDDEDAVADALDRQLVRFRSLTSREPSHLDSHQHAHLREPARTVFRSWAKRLHVPVRHFSPTVRYCGEFYGQTNEGAALRGAISPKALVCLLSALPAGTTEVACHPASRCDFGGVYREERLLELAALCSPEVRRAAAADSVLLCSFDETRR